MNYYLNGGLEKITYIIEYGNLLFSTDGISKEITTMTKEKIKIPLPVNLKDSERDRFVPFQIFEPEQIQVMSLKNVFTTRAGIVTKNLKLVEESVYAYKDRHSKYWKSALFNFLFKRWEVLNWNHKYTIIQNYYCPGYYHWLTEALPRLIALGENTKDLILILPEYNEPSVEETLSLFQFKDIKRVKENCTLMAHQLVLPTHPKFGDTFDSIRLKKLRKLFTNHVISSGRFKSQCGSKIYISRNKARARKVANEFEVFELLHSKGFTEVCFEEYSFFEQVMIMSQATHLVSIHGAGLTNMIFMPEGGHVLEFYRDFVSEDEYHSKGYWRLAGAMGLQYSYQLCLTDDIPQSLDTDDLVVDLDELKQNLEIMGL